jgi:AmmeMemoRadiSam system protein A
MELSREQGELLLQVARLALEEKLGRKPSGEEIARRRLAGGDATLQEPCGTFVTLKLKGGLRGCIGTLAACEPLLEGVQRNAVNAGFHDPRFPPLAEAECDAVKIEVSVLTPPRPLDFLDADDLLSRLRPGVDGVILRKGHACATFLPQVWSQLPRPEDFLGHLCLKAGLGRDAWKKAKVEVSVYRVQSFAEPPPAGAGKD